MLTLRPLTAVALVCALAVSAVDPPDRGENCDWSSLGRGECATGLICYEDDTGTDVCQDSLTEGTECDYEFSRCGVGLSCSKDEKCVRAKKLGDSCERYDDCGRTATCGPHGDSPTCVEFAAEAEPCAQSYDCANGLKCYEGICVARAREGNSCGNVGWCVSWQLPFMLP